MENEFGESDSAEDTRTRRQVRAANRRLLNSAARKHEHTALTRIVKAKRMSHQEAAVDLHRRQLAVATLAHKSVPIPDPDWSSFLGLNSTGQTDESSQPPTSTATDGSNGSADQASQASIKETTPATVAVIDPPTKAARLESTDMPRQLRDRPIRSHLSTTARDNQSALRSILGINSDGQSARAPGTRSVIPMRVVGTGSWGDPRLGTSSSVRLL